MTSPPGIQTDRELLRSSGALLLGGFLFTTLVTVLFHPGGNEDVHEDIFARYAASATWEWVHFAQFVDVLVALGGLIVLHQVLRPRAGRLSAFAAGMTVATAAVWAVLQAVDGVTLKQAVDAWVAADGPERAARLGDAEVVRWTEWGLQRYFRVTLGLALLLFGATMLVTRALAAWIGWVTALAGFISVAVGVDVAYSGLQSAFQGLAVPAFQVLMLVVGVGVLVSARRERAPVVA
ncbi:hypothetical protein SAMN05660350_04544 [Geodermatophilus obscurus]|uniref:DUF4386 family protein n=1 Tax=Geodermatophilus obscurus TaxID=1861 RepID=A0A1M7UZU8_9ACTN|nr:hypothetical protein [Geodermatophilus obscurus]SHN88499.1 hypothetical protein SAMN05660350_04544 [Geodermatophilus obscurus]